MSAQTPSISIKDMAPAQSTINAAVSTADKAPKTSVLAPKATGLAEQISFTPDQLTLMKNTVAKGATDDEFMLLLHLAKTYGLDPFAKEIWCIKYGNAAATIFSSRDGYLKIASRNQQMDGIQSDAVCAGDTLKKLPDGTVDHAYGAPRGAVTGAYALVYRKDRAVPAYFYASFAEYGAGSNPTWKKYPSAMIIKVAEAMALKRAFSISGLVTQEEIGLEMLAAPEAETSASVVVEAPKKSQPEASAPASVEPAACTASGPSSVDPEHLGALRAAILATTSTLDLKDLWEKMAPAYKHLLANDKEEAKQRITALVQQAAATVVREAPATMKIAGNTTGLVDEFADKPVFGPGPAVDYATGEQQQEITRLLNHPLITRQEKTKMLLNIKRLDRERARQAIVKLRGAIADREGIDPRDAVRASITSFVLRGGRKLTAQQTEGLTSLAADPAATLDFLVDALELAQNALIDEETYGTDEELAAGDGTDETARIAA